MKKTYEKNVFSKIISGEIPCDKVFENDTIIAFHDINPRAKTHVLVIPKANHVDFSSFVENASNIDFIQFFYGVNFVAEEVLKLEHFRIQINNGAGAGQEVFHFHVHILAN